MNKILLATVLALLAGGGAKATGFTWVPVSGTNDWSTAANWTPAGGPPGVSSTDTAAFPIPSTASGVINYTSAGPKFANLNVVITNPAVVTINIGAPLVLQDGAIWGGTATQTGLHVVVTSGGSITSLLSTSSYSMTLNGGYFDVDAGGTMLINRDTGPWKAWNVNGTKVTLRGAVKMPGGSTFTGTCPTMLGDNTSLTLDGGSLETDALNLAHNCNVLFTANGGRLCTQLTGNGIYMGAGGSYTYQNYLTLLTGTITNDSRFIAGYANTWGGESHTAGAGQGGIATVNLSGGTFVQRGYTAIGNGRVGNMAVSGTVFRTVSDFYIGGGDYLGAVVPNANIAVSGRVSLVSGSITITNVPHMQASTGVANQNGNSQIGAAQFYVDESTQLWTGQRIAFTNLSAGISGLSTGVIYYVKMFRWNANAKCFNVAAYPGPLAPSLGVAVATNVPSQWQTFPAIMSVGNTATFSTGTRLAPGVLDVAGGSFLVDQLVATNGVRSVIRFTKGTLAVQLSSLISNSVPFVAGNGVDAAVLALSGGTHSFADGLVINTNAVFAVGGTNAVGTAAVTGNVTLQSNAVLDFDFNAATNDVARIEGTLTLPASATLRARTLDGSLRNTITLVQATTISGSVGAWSPVVVNGLKYRAVISGGELILRNSGTTILLY